MADRLGGSVGDPNVPIRSGAGSYVHRARVKVCQSDLAGDAVFSGLVRADESPGRIATITHNPGVDSEIKKQMEEPMMNVDFNASYDDNNLYHYLISMVLTLFIFSLLLYNLGYTVSLSRQWAFWGVWALGWLWEIGDLFKANSMEGFGKPLWKQILFYSWGFSVWDVFVPDLLGCLVGIAITYFIWL